MEGTIEPKYDIALSFAGEDRPYVAEVAAVLRDQGIQVFYDDYEQIALWGKDLYSHLDWVYRSAARYCVLFVSEHYATKVWTNHERRSAQARAISENKEYVLPVRFDDSDVEGLLPTIGYLDLRRLTPADLADRIKEKLGPLRVTAGFPPITPPRPGPTIVKVRTLIIVKREKPGRVPEVLTYWSPAWKARLFYNTTQRDDDIVTKCRTSLFEVFRVPGDRVAVDGGRGKPLVVHKQSQDVAERGLGVVEYRFTIQPVTVHGLPKTLMDDGRVIGRDGYEYSFATLASLKEDERAMEVNGVEINCVSREFGGNTLAHIEPST